MVKKFARWKIGVLILVDIVLIYLSYIIAFLLRFDGTAPKKYIEAFTSSSVVIVPLYIFCFYLFKLYESLWTQAGIDEFLLSVGGCIVPNIFILCYDFIFKQQLPFTITILSCLFTIIFVIGFRMSFRIYRRVIIYFNYMNLKDFKKVMVVGAGSAGNMIIKEMKKHPEMKYRAEVLIDDSVTKLGAIICGVKVLGNRSSIVRIAKEKNIEEIIIAIPSLDKESKKEIVNICKETNCKIKIMPGVYDFIENKSSLKQIREVDVEDLLGRDPIKLDSDGIEHYIKDKVILVTGGGGSIGSELCRQIAKFSPKELLILDIYENNAYDLQNELKYNFPNLNLKIIIASVRDKRRLEKVFEEYRPEVIFHAAAHKHVPLMEDNPSEAIKNNVFGTYNMTECADRFGVKRFVLISTDKAVNPTNVMGASKRMCEMIIQAMNKQSNTEFVAVRFGNVLGSNGSVIPLFKRQIANGGPVTLTNKYITRFFMTIPEAAQLVLQAGAYAEGGEIFVLDMGKPVKIYDLACDLIRLSGFEPHKDIKIEITGLRPGEKLYEELLMAEEGLGKTKHEKIFVGRPTFTDMNVLKKGFDEFRFIIENGNKEDIVRKVEELVPTYVRTTNEKSVDVSSEVDVAIDEAHESKIVDVG